MFFFFFLACDQAFFLFSFFFGGGKKIRVVSPPPPPRQKKKSPDRRLLWSLSPALRNLWLLLVLNSNFLCLSCPSAFFALHQGGFVPREWLVAKGLVHCLLLFTLFNSCCFALYVIMFHGSSKITLPFKFVYYETISNLFHLFYLSFHILITESYRIILYLGRSSKRTLWALRGDTLTKFKTMILFSRSKKWIQPSYIWIWLCCYEDYSN